MKNKELRNFSFFGFSSISIGLLFFSISIIYNHQSFDLLKDPLSFLGSKNALYPFIFNSGIIISGFLSTLFLTFYLKNINLKIIAKIGFIFSLFASISFMGVGIFRMDFPLPILHIIFTTLFFITGFIALMLLGFFHKRILLYIGLLSFILILSFLFGGEFIAFIELSSVLSFCIAILFYCVSDRIMINHRLNKPFIADSPRKLEKILEQIRERTLHKK